MRNLTFLLAILFPTLSFTQNAPDFTITTSDGSELSLYGDLLNNDKTVLIKFFFTSCSPCRAISPSVETLYQEWGGGNNDVEFISLSIQNFDDNNDVAMFKTQYGLTFPGAGVDGDAVIASQPYLDNMFGSFNSTPTFAVIAPDGSVNFDVRSTSFEHSVWMATLDAALTATGAEKPSVAPPINYFSATGNIYGGNGNLLTNTEVLVSTETNTTSLTENPFSINNIEENTALEVQLTAPNLPLLTGVTTYDLVLINDHVLGINEFEAPYQLIAADVNNDGAISTFDIILLRQLILDIIQDLPNDRNWLIFQGTPQNLTSSPTTGNTITINPITENIENMNFTVVKVGDVDGGAY